MKKGSIFLLFFLLSSVYSQQGIYNSQSQQVSNNFNIQRHAWYNCAEQKNYEEYFQDYDYNTGILNWDSINQSGCWDHNSREHRSCWQVNFYFPSNAINKKIYLKVYGNGYSGSIVELTPVAAGYSNKNFFDYVGGASALFSYSTQNQGTWQDVTSFALQTEQYGYFVFGALSSSARHNLTIQCLIAWETPVHISFENNMGGQLSVNSSNYTGSYSNDYWLNTNISLSVNEPQTASGYTWVWNDSEAPLNKSEWTKIKNGETGKSNNQSYSFSVTADDHNSTYKAYMRKVCNITFQNYLVGLSNYGTLTVNGQPYNSPTSQFQVVEQNAINVSANTYYYNNYIEYNFSQWNDGNTSYSRTIYPNANTTYTASFIGKPSNSGEYAGCSGNVGDPIVVTWTDNPNTAVNQFQIWRKVKHNGVTGDPFLLTTVGRGVQSYTDYDYVWTDGYTNDLIQYDVRAYYSTEGTYSDPNYVSAFGRENANIQSQNGQIAALIKEIPTDYSINNYPNPFNPTTTINYQLPENGFVTIKIYDMLGKEIATLVNEQKSAGYHTATFDASKLTSGVYIYTINVNSFTQSRKMLLMK